MSSIVSVCQTEGVSLFKLVHLGTPSPAPRPVQTCSLVAHKRAVDLPPKGLLVRDVVVIHRRFVSFSGHFIRCNFVL